MIKENITKIKNSIPKNIVIVAVTKNRYGDDINKAISAGIKDIGENKVQEAQIKLPSIKGVKKHFIGHLQKNKVKKAVELFDVIQSVDSLELARKIDKECSAINKKMEIMIQVNIGKELQKFGVMPEHALEFYREIRELKNIKITGLMCIAPNVHPDNTRIYFKKMRELNNILKLRHLSMGMSNDYKIAVEEGSNMVRIGREIFEAKY